MTPARPDRATTDRSTVQVIVTRSSEPLDFDQWAARYVRLVLEADRRATLQEAA